MQNRIFLHSLWRSIAARVAADRPDAAPRHPARWAFCPPVAAAWNAGRRARRPDRRQHRRHALFHQAMRCTEVCGVSGGHALLSSVAVAEAARSPVSAARLRLGRLDHPLDLSMRHSAISGARGPQRTPAARPSSHSTGSHHENPPSGTGARCRASALLDRSRCRRRLRRRTARGRRGDGNRRSNLRLTP
jgi:hypothetical protein